MGFSAPSLQLLTCVFCLALAYLYRHECEASSLQQARSLRLHDPAGSLYGQLRRSRLRGAADAQEMEKDMLEALHELERAVHTEEATADANFMLSEGSNNEDIEEGEDKEEQEEERHPADELLQRHQADATISYILGGY